MSVSDVELVRQAYAAAGREPPAVETMLRLYAPDHVLTTNWGVAEGRDYEGFEGFQRALVDIAETIDDFRNDLEDAVDAGDGVVVAVIRATGRGRSSGTPVDARVGAVVRVRDGVIVATTYHAHLDEAFEAAGLEPPR